METESKSGKSLLRVMTYATALSLGVMAAVIASMRRGAEEGVFEFSWKTILAFVVGFAAGWAFWRFIRLKIQRADSGRSN